MEIKVLWSDSAIEELKEIHDYFVVAAGLKIATKIVNAILDKSILLEKNPRLGQEEDLLKHKSQQIRYLVEGNYKIVYFIAKNHVVIATVFDCRQNPKKLAETSL